ncbi:Gmad2 immunoglobulin-like domain-containing protein [Neolewinella agarilytica]|uniref:Immunoglobulin-like domain of spore germination n=1 Tax=Neolewinella agarilytica TaxID=478744 RepID=A0A1H9EJG5_9BACT|nr:Gmad2 immunoglobulin-like domain-containing protein [Neolewinella agarilytica]SEQ25755.1 Immunoglobulin-like domain of spore germination [Neolewinella agarilytica]
MLIRICAICLLFSLFSCGEDGSKGPTAEVAAEKLAKQGIVDFNPNNDTRPLDSLLRLDSPKPGAKLSSPFTVRGEASTSFFFEAAMPYQITDEQGNLIGEGFVKPKKFLMNKGVATFDYEISYDAPAGTKGFLRLKNNDASRVDKFERAMTIPVVL